MDIVMAAIAFWEALRDTLANEIRAPRSRRLSSA
jgi:hypothetical protein